MNKFENIISELKIELEKVHYQGDLSDIGNEIGIVIGKYIVENKMGYEYESFIAGLKHGISIANGTH